MDNKISILHLEDQISDSLLIKALLGKWFSFDYFLTDDEAGFIRILEENKIDVILSDYEIPGYSGAEALALARKNYHHIPFIFVTGKMGEDSAIESLLNGATDYVMKSKLERLAPAIKRVIHESELLKSRIASDHALQASEERYRGLIMNLDAGVVVHAPDTTVTMANPKASELLGLNQSELMGMKAIDPTWHFLSEDYAKLPVDLFPVNQIIKQNGSIKDFRIGVNRPTTNDIVWLTVNGSPVMNTDGSISEIIISFLDITERKHAEDALRKEQYLMEILMNNIPDHLYFKDLQSRFIRISKSKNESFGIQDASEAIGKTDFDYFSEEHARAAYQDELEIMRTGRPLIKEEKETWPDRPDTWTHSTKLPLVDQEGRIIGTFGISRDISDRKRFEQELLIAKEKAEASDRLKTAFLRNISHEIRTPLNGILGFIPLMSDPDLTPEEKEEYQLMVNESSDRLIGTIANIMDTAMIVSGNQEVKEQQVALSSILSELYNQYHHRCEQKKLSFQIQQSPAVVGLIIQTDQELLLKILFHLLDNALKFTRNGTITVGCTTHEDAIEFSVKDTGIGIKSGEQKRIFELFTQGNATVTREHDGTGLGLSIAKGLVDLLGGHISVESVEGEGSVFSFELPNKNIQKKTDDLEPKIKSVSENPVILVADDIEINCVLINRLLRKEGIEVLMVYDGRQAVEACRQNPSISLVLMDLKMPVMDGFEATRLIKAANPELPVIALTAYAMGGDENKAAEAGCDDYLTKPISREQLIYKLIQFGILHRPPH